MASNVPAIKQLLDHDTIVSRLEELSENSAVFNASLIGIVSESKQLQTCTAQSIVQSALKAVALKLPIDKTLGFAYIVPYGATAQFQLGYRGYVQLAIRSGQYETINSVNVYKDEFESYNPVTGELGVKGYSGKVGDRQKGGEVVGYYAYFSLKNGFRHSYFMGKTEMEAFARKYSKAYNYDISKRKRSSPWSTEFDSMGRKTVLKSILRTYGLLSVDMIDAIKGDDFEDDTYTQEEERQTVEVPAVIVEDTNPI